MTRIPLIHFMSKAWAVRQAFYGTGAGEPSVTFDLTPNPTPDVTESLLEIDGEWAFFRLLAKAQVPAISQTTFTPTWTLTSSDGREFDVRYKLQPRNLQNPFAVDFFRNVNCPEKVTSGGF